MKRTGTVWSAFCAVLLLRGAHSVEAVTGRWESIGPMAAEMHLANLPRFPTVYSVAFGPDGVPFVANALGIFQGRSDGSWSPSLQVPGNQVFFPTFLPFAQVARLDDSPVMLAGLANGGLYRSTDAGASWTIVLYGSGFLSLARASSSPSTVYATIQQPSLTQATTYRTTDSGATWTPISGFGTAPVYAMAVDTASADVLYASVGPSSGGPPAGLSLSRDGGGTWQKLSTGLPDDTFIAVAADPVTSGIVYAGANSSGVFRSSDGGTTWAAVNSGLGDLRVRELAIDPQTPSVVYAGTTRGVYRSDDSGGHWIPLGLHQEAISALALDPSSPSTVYAGVSGGVERITLAPTAPCAADAGTLCLNGGRFRVQATFRTNKIGSRGDGQSVPISDFAGGFWFFDAANVELVVKVLDGTAENGHFWILYGALSDVEYTITVTDTVTGAIQSYFGFDGFPPVSVADITALPGSPPTPGGSSSSPIAARPATSGGLCTPDATTLCLLDGRFQARVEWQTASGAAEAAAPAVPLTSDSGYFWFFQQPNVEIALKVLDGTAVDGHFWVFYASLSNVAFTVTVTDLQTGAVRVYDNPAGKLASVADTSAF
ncbi:MAG TPA: sialidase family protein [Thermoanaerobaculia bacterium]|nr:sialidase family protein [Thermoanaerobaculia bacterium]